MIGNSILEEFRVALDIAADDMASAEADGDVETVEEFVIMRGEIAGDDPPRRPNEPEGSA